MKVFQPLPYRTGDSYMAARDTLRDEFRFDAGSLDATTDVPIGGCRIASEWLHEDGSPIRILSGHKLRGGAL
jgi:hypothetical protein